MTTPEREWRPGDQAALPPVPDDCYPPDAVPLRPTPHLDAVKAERDQLRVERDAYGRVVEAARLWRVAVFADSLDLPTFVDALVEAVDALDALDDGEA